MLGAQGYIHGGRTVDAARVEVIEVGHHGGFVHGGQRAPFCQVVTLPE